MDITYLPSVDNDEYLNSIQIVRNLSTSLNPREFNLLLLDLSLQFRTLDFKRYIPTSQGE
ncbi:hypothetical protein [Candidatus Liberibacter americanus]|uniref:Uncharacterized protein n=1 Tax=Candidatus Liberibacter americanus str. Sao Paulo TaxID=1261131 RepID=U6B888_9HYPH|nr:hypothetical protein [Candidatus Liberibacter americanus]AHA28081.1 hypothetical protein lam_735 [Candidatus Liberibacter americanus str. Sao Paulo]